MSMISQENKLIDMTGLNRFRIGDEVVAEACAEHDRFEGVVIGIELQRVYASRALQPSITLLHDGDQITDGFSPDDLRKVSDFDARIRSELVEDEPKQNYDCPCIHPSQCDNSCFSASPSPVDSRELIERLVKALSAFAEAADIFEREYGDKMKPDTGCNIKFSALCEARAVLASKEQQS